jgi:hypothetical protein
MSEVRIDPVLGTVVHVVGTRQERPNLPSSGCPFCVGGIEAPEPYDVRSFPNRWPAMEEDRCEVVLYTSEHLATFPSLGPAGARNVIDLWADRTVALGARPDVDDVLVFENQAARRSARRSIIRTVRSTRTTTCRRASPAGSQGVGSLVAVGPLHDDAKGELAKAYVVLKPGASADETELIEFCRAELAAYKVPRAVQFVDDLPKTSTGKIMRRALASLDP